MITTLYSNSITKLFFLKKEMGEEVKIGRNTEVFMPFNYYYITDAYL
jgi:hypothetical protein